MGTAAKPRLAPERVRQVREVAYHFVGCLMELAAAGDNADEEAAEEFRQLVFEDMPLRFTDEDKAIFDEACDEYAQEILKRTCAQA